MASNGLHPYKTRYVGHADKGTKLYGDVICDQFSKICIVINYEWI